MKILNTTSANLEDGANVYMRRGVSEIKLTNMGTLLIDYDDNNNSKLDIDSTVADGGTEWNKIVTDPNVSSNGFNVLHVNALCVKIGQTWYDVTGVSYGDWIVVTDSSLSKTRTLAHEILHKLSLKDIGPENNNTSNIMYYMNNATKYFIGYFKVEKVQTASGTSYYPKQYQLQWDAINRTSN